MPRCPGKEEVCWADFEQLHGLPERPQTGWPARAAAGPYHNPPAGIYASRQMGITPQSGCHGDDVADRDTLIYFIGRVFQFQLMNLLSPPVGTEHFQCWREPHGVRSARVATLADIMRR